MKGRHGLHNCPTKVRDRYNYYESWFYYTMVCTVKGTKTHIYWSMKNSGGNADKLKQNVLATSKHYQVYFL